VCLVCSGYALDTWHCIVQMSFDWQMTGHTAVPHFTKQTLSVLSYLSPQKTSRCYDNKVDIYALGLVLVEILCPFKTEHERTNSFRNMQQNPVELPSTFTSSFHYQVRSAQSCLTNLAGFKKIVIYCDVCDSKHWQLNYWTKNFTTCHRCLVCIIAIGLTYITLYNISCNNANITQAKITRHCFRPTSV